MFHKEGFKIILVSFTITMVVALIAHYCIDIEWIRMTIQLLAFVFLIAILQFFRNPKRVTPKNDTHIIAPVDGKVVVIEEVFEKEYFKDKRLQVSIFMSPLDVHVTRCSLGGKVTYSKYHPGKYLVRCYTDKEQELWQNVLLITLKWAIQQCKAKMQAL